VKRTSRKLSKSSGGGTGRSQGKTIPVGFGRERDQKEGRRKNKEASSERHPFREHTITGLGGGLSLKIAISHLIRRGGERNPSTEKGGGGDRLTVVGPIQKILAATLERIPGEIKVKRTGPALELHNSLMLNAAKSNSWSGGGARGGGTPIKPSPSRSFVSCSTSRAVQKKEKKCRKRG